MLGLSSGGLETHYSLDSSADTVLTPDFRILFAGPGEFHFAVSTDPHGNTCVRGLRGNTSSAIVSELLGDRVYQVKPAEQAVFHSGRIDKVDTDVPLECGCPPPVPVMRTDASPARTVQDSELPQSVTLAQNNASADTAPQSDNASRKTDSRETPGRQTLSNGPETQPLPPAKPDDIQVKVDAPFIFRGKKTTEAQPTPTTEAASLPVMQSSDRPTEPAAPVQPPSGQNPAGKPPSHGLVRRVKGFFAAIFR